MSTSKIDGIETNNLTRYGYTKRWIDWIAWIGADADAEQMYERRRKRLAICSLSINIMSIVVKQYLRKSHLNLTFCTLMSLPLVLNANLEIFFLFSLWC